MKKPFVPRDLVDYLQKAFPNRLPVTYIPPDQLGSLQGEQRVIAHLAQLCLNQNVLAGRQLQD